MTDTSSTSPKRAAIIVNPAKPVDIDVRGLVAKHCVENGWGEAIWLEGVALIGLYGIIAAAFWWG